MIFESGSEAFVHLVAREASPASLRRICLADLEETRSSLRLGPGDSPMRLSPDGHSLAVAHGDAQAAARQVLLGQPHASDAS